MIPHAESPSGPAADPGSARDAWSWLAEFHVRRIPVSLRTGDGSHSGVSSVLAVDSKRRLMLLEALNQPGLRVASGDVLHLETDLDEWRLGFSCRVHDLVKIPEGNAYLAGDPQLHRSESRRSAHRLHLQSSMLLDAAIAQRDIGKLPAQVLDLSKGGFGAQSNAGPVVPHGARVHCSLVLPDVKVFVEATVRHTHVEGEGLRLGLQFSDVTPILESELNRAMKELEDQLGNKKDPAP